MTGRITFLALGIVMTALAAGVYAYLIGDIKTSVDAIAVTEGDIASAGARAARAQSAQAFLAGTAHERAELESFIAGDENIVAAIEAIEGEAKRDKVAATISSVAREPMDEWGHHELVRVEISGTGSFEALGAFTAALEALPFASRLTSVSLQGGTGSSWYGTFTVRVVAQTTP